MRCVALVTCLVIIKPQQSLGRRVTFITPPLFLDLLDLRALLGFERWQSANKSLPLGSVKDHLGSIGGVEASIIIIEVVLD